MLLLSRTPPPRYLKTANFPSELFSDLILNVYTRPFPEYPVWIQNLYQNGVRSARNPVNATARHASLGLELFKHANYFSSFDKYDLIPLNPFVLNCVSNLQ